jgi:hypothetical protein
MLEPENAKICAEQLKLGSEPGLEYAKNIAIKPGKEYAVKYIVNAIINVEYIEIVLRFLYVKLFATFTVIVLSLGDVKTAHTLIHAKHLNK